MFSDDQDGQYVRRSILLSGNPSDEIISTQGAPAASVPPEPPTLSDERIPATAEAVDAAIEKAQAELSALCGGKRFLMSIPARPDADSDIVIGTALAFAKHHVAALRAEVAKAATIIEKLSDDDECQFDHHGYCQTHRLEADCSNARARAWLAARSASGEDRNGRA